MSTPAESTLYYVHDPMCSWCWGFRPVWLSLQQRLPTSIHIVSWVGGLAPDSDTPMDQGMQQNLQATWRRIQEKIPGTRFNFDFWTQNRPRRSTYPACRAVICAREMADQEAAMALAIQQAYYLEARNPSDLKTLVDLAHSIGLDRRLFEDKMRSPETHQTLLEELERVRAIGVYSFPSLVIEKDHHRLNIPIDYLSSGNLFKQIQHFLQTESH